MVDSETFAHLMTRVRAGEDDAARELLRRYEPAIRRVVRLRLADPRLSRQFDSTDICQSVLASFFTRAALGQYQLDNPDQLLRLLTVMARNKFVNWTRKRRIDALEPAAPGAVELVWDAIADTSPSPSRQVAGREILEKFRAGLSVEERRLADQRALGREWAEIAAELGGSPEALRKKLARAIDRVAGQLGLEV